MLYRLSLTDTHVGAWTRSRARLGLCRSVGLLCGDAKEEQKSGVSHTIRSPKPHSFRLPTSWGADLRAAAGQFFLGCLRRHLPASVGPRLQTRCSGAAAAASHVRTASVLRAGRTRCCAPHGPMPSYACHATVATAHRRPLGCWPPRHRRYESYGAAQQRQRCQEVLCLSMSSPAGSLSRAAGGAHRETLSHTHA